MLKRLSRHLALISPAPMAIAMLAGCAMGGPSVWTHYDTCDISSSSFVAMVECGKQRRTASCVKANDCSEGGTAFVQYADALSLSVRNREMTESQARLKFIEYKTTFIGNSERNEAVRRAGSSGGTTTCRTIGNNVHCY